MGYRHAEYQFADAAFGDIGATFAPVLTLTKDAVGMVFLNDLDASVDISFDGTNVAFTLAASEPLIINMESMNRIMAAGEVSAKRTSGAPTSGSLRITAII